MGTTRSQPKTPSTFPDEPKQDAQQDGGKARRPSASPFGSGAGPDSEYRGIHKTQAGWQLDASKNHCALLHFSDRNLKFVKCRTSPYLVVTLAKVPKRAPNSESVLFCPRYPL